MSGRRYSRRTLLRRGGAMVGAGALASMAGCLDRIPNPFSDSYTAWLPAPDAFDMEHYFFNRWNNDDWIAVEDEFSDDYDGDTYEEFWEPASIPLSDISQDIYLADIGVLQADFETADVVDDLEDEDFDEEADREGYTIYLNDDERRAFALDGSTVVLTAPYYEREQEPQAAVEAVIDAKAGNGDRYVDESDACSKLVDALGTKAGVFGETFEDSEDDPEKGQFDGMVARGNTVNFDGATTDLVWVVVYEDESDVDTGDLEAWVEASRDGEYGPFTDVDDIEYKNRAASVASPGRWTPTTTSSSPGWRR